MASPMAKRSRYGLVFVTPYFIVFAVFGIYPILYSLYLSFTNSNGFSESFVGLANYAHLLHDQLFYQALGNTVTIWLISIIPQVTLALVLALILNEKFIKGRHFFRAVFFLPNIVTPVTIGVLVDLMFDWQTGFVNKLFMSLGLIQQPIYWFGHPFLTQLVVGGVMCWQWFGYNMLIFIAGLQSIDPELYEAAAMDGATKPQMALRISLPLLRPVLLFIVITSIIGGLQIFDVPMMVGNAVGNATQTLLVFLYKTGFVNFNYGYAAAIAYATFVIIVVFTLISFKLANRRTR